MLSESRRLPALGLLSRTDTARQLTPAVSECHTLGKSSSSSVDLPEQPRHRPPGIRIHRLEVDDVGQSDRSGGDSASGVRRSRRGRPGRGSGRGGKSSRAFGSSVSRRAREVARHPESRRESMARSLGRAHTCTVRTATLARMLLPLLVLGSCSFWGSSAEVLDTPFPAVLSTLQVRSQSCGGGRPPTAPSDSPSG
jgi:hypothetical protein